MGTPMVKGAPPTIFISDMRPSRVATIEAAVVKLVLISEVNQRTGEMEMVRNRVLPKPLLPGAGSRFRTNHLESPWIPRCHPPIPMHLWWVMGSFVLPH